MQRVKLRREDHLRGVYLRSANANLGKVSRVEALVMFFMYKRNPKASCMYQTGRTWLMRPTSVVEALREGDEVS